MGKKEQGRVAEKANDLKPPKLASRRSNRKSGIKLGRTIAGKRERLETSSERMAARKKVQKQKIIRLSVTRHCVYALLLFGAVWHCGLFYYFDTK